MELRPRRLLAACLLLGLVPCAASQEDLPPAPGSVDAGLSLEVRESLAGLDPARVGWQSETDERAVVEQLYALVGLWRAGEGRVAPEELLAPGFSVEPLVPTELEEIDRGAWKIARASAPTPNPRRGADALLASLAALDARFAPSAVKTKVVALRYGETEGALETDVRVEAEAEAAQSVSHWRCGWTRVDDGWRLASIAVDDYVEVRGPGPVFRDASSAVLTGPLYEQQFVPGLPYWRTRLDTSLGVGFLGHHGLAIGDVDGDGLEDVYVCQPGGLPNRLFMHAADGTVRDGAAASGVDFLDPTSSALLVDLDGDADPDLVLALGDEVVVFENESGRFTLRSKSTVSGTTSMAAADVDLDGDVDVFICGYVSPYDGSGMPLPYHDANNGQRNTLLRNDGDLGFTDVTDEAGLGATRRFSFAAAFEDIDDDGDQDLYVANDFGRNELYRNDAGRFVLAAKALGVEDLSAGMGVSFGDFDRDGRVDLYVSNMFSAAGGRVAYQRNFRAGDDEGTRADYQRHARGNTLFRNVGVGGFADVTARAGVGMGRWAWGALLRDFDGDGWDDVLVPNGFVTERRADDL
ncbi:MAG: VCBS repeat-containing protein [bacterium]|nr:VCBS repeat-containing protein [bacterium]